MRLRCLAHRTFGMGTSAPSVLRARVVAETGTAAGMMGVLSRGGGRSPAWPRGSRWSATRDDAEAHARVALPGSFGRDAWPELCARRQHAMLNFIATELHKQFSPLFHSPTDEVRAKQQGLIASRFDLIEKTLSKQPYLLGDHFTAPDAYLFNMLRWVEVSKLELARWPALSAFYQRMLERPAVKAALEA